MLKRVAVPVIDEFAMFEFGVICEVFGLDRSYAGIEPFDFRVCSATPGEPIRNETGVQLIAPYGLDAMEDADLIAVPAATIRDEYPRSSSTASGARTPGAPSCSASAPARSCSAPPACSTAARARRTGATPTPSSAASRSRG